MSFGSMTFLFGFLPAVLLCYFLLPARFRTGHNLILLAFSLIVWLFAFTKKEIKRSEGLIMVLLYALYVVYICIR